MYHRRPTWQGLGPSGGSIVWASRFDDGAKRGHCDQKGGNRHGLSFREVPAHILPRVKRLRLADLRDLDSTAQVFSDVVPGSRIYNGGLSFHSPGKITHAEDRPHVHDDAEIFCLLQGEGWIEINGVQEPVRAGDVLVIEPGDDHHLISSEHNPLINLWLHANQGGHPIQFR